MNVEGYLAGETVLRPSVAVVVYAGPNDALATVHPVLSRDGQAPVLGAGENLTRASLAALTEKLTRRQGKARRLLPECVLCADEDLLAWHRPAQHRAVFFDTGRPDLDALNRRQALHPALCFALDAKGLRVFALSDNTRPTASTPLFRAPYFNVWATGRMCSGNVPLPRKPDPDLDTIEGCERTFFDSSFAHTNMGGAMLTRYPGGHTGLWTALCACGHSFFPAWSLVTMDVKGKALKLGDMLDGKEPM